MFKEIKCHSSKKRTIEAIMSRSKICNTFLQNKIDENRKCKTNKFPVPLL